MWRGAVAVVLEVDEAQAVAAEQSIPRDVVVLLCSISLVR